MAIKQEISPESLAGVKSLGMMVGRDSTFAMNRMEHNLAEPQPDLMAALSMPSGPKMEPS